MAHSNSRIRTLACKMKRRGLDGSDEDLSEDISERNPHRKLTMSEDITQPCKKSKFVVPDSDDSPASENEMTKKACMRKTLYSLLSPFIKLTGKLFRDGACTCHYHK